MCSWLPDLPAEMWTHILNHVAPIYAGIARLVCRRWAERIRSPTCDARMRALNDLATGSALPLLVWAIRQGAVNDPLLKRMVALLPSDEDRVQFLRLAMSQRDPIFSTEGTPSGWRATRRDLLWAAARLGAWETLREGLRANTSGATDWDVFAAAARAEHPRAFVQLATTSGAPASILKAAMARWPKEDDLTTALSLPDPPERRCVAEFVDALRNLTSVVENVSSDGHHRVRLGFLRSEVLSYRQARARACEEYWARVSGLQGRISRGDESLLSADVLPVLQEIRFGSAYALLRRFGRTECDALVSTIFGLLNEMNRHAALYCSVPGGILEVMERRAYDIAHQIQTGSLLHKDLDILSIGRSVVDMFEGADASAFDALMENTGALNALLHDSTDDTVPLRALLHRSAGL